MLDQTCPAQLPAPGGQISPGAYTLTGTVLGGTLGIQPDGGCGASASAASIGLQFTATSNANELLFEVVPEAPLPRQAGLATISPSGKAITFGPSSCDGGRILTPGPAWFFSATPTSFLLDQRRAELPDGGGLDTPNTSFLVFTQ